MAETKQLSWKPRRSGAIYCAPACGGRCTYEAFQRATREANALCKKLGEGWQPTVWENLGWHWCVQKGVKEYFADTEFVSVCLSGDGKTYRAEVHFTEQFFGNDRHPVLAVEKAFKAAQQHVNNVNKRFAKIKAFLNK